ncbi:MAG TPA: FG-GAP-like repeat-containing protein [Abditibacterium sp.]
MKLFRSKRIYPVLLVAGLSVLGGYVYWLRQRPPDAETPLYQSAVKVFFSGLVALQANDLNRASQYLTQVTQQIPREPAGWANLGISQTRLSNYPAAARSLAEASRLTPQNPRIEAALADLESAQGHFDAAIPHLRRVLSLDASNVRARYALAQALGNTGDASKQAEVRTLYDGILKTNPRNLVVLIETLRLSAAAGDAPGFGAKLKQLRRLAGAMDPEARELLEGVENAARTSVGAAAVPLIPLTNVLKPSAPYQSSLAELGANTETGAARTAEPLERFIWLKPQWPTTQPSAPDLKLSFAAQPFAAIAIQTSAQNSALSAVYLDERGTPAVFAATSGTAASGAASGQVQNLSQRGAILPFAAGALSAGVAPAALQGVTGLDWNFDFKNDLLLAGAGGLRLWQQGASNSFSDVTAGLKLPPAITNASYAGAWAADIEADGDLDVVLAPRAGQPLVIRNNSDGTGQILRLFAGAEAVRGFSWADFDDDGAIDAAFLDSRGQLRVFANARAGSFSARAAPSNADNLLAISAADINSDGVVDLLALRRDGEIVRFSSSSDAQKWDAVTIAQWEGLPTAQPGAARLLVADLDNNGSLDLVASQGSATRLWLGDENNKLQLLAAPLTGAVFAALDLNADGRLDLAALNAQGAPTQWLNRGTLAYHWQVLRPRAQAISRAVSGEPDQGSGNQRVNSFGVGGTLEARSALLYQKQLIQGPVVHFGLGTHTSTDAARIIWTNGVAQGEFNLKADQSIQAPQRPIGSCPYLWAFDGSGINFIKDCNWRSPLGLKINAQDTAGVVQTEDWIKVRGEQIAARDGFYDLRVTADLWEAHLFDSLSLMVVDHPVGTEIWIDERFSIPMPPLRVLVTKPSQPIARARDDRGHDVTATVSALDRQYLDTFGRGRYQGVTRDHWVEVELPPGADSGINSGAPLWLIAEGWLNPTDSSINVALAQGKHPAPRDLSLEVADGRGGWIVAQPHLGFPAGKNKAITLDLRGVFRPGAPRRLRLRTNLEIYWDRLTWATSPSASASPSASPNASISTSAAVRPLRLLPQVAQLRFRGVSPESKVNRSSPALPGRYEDVVAGQPWRDLVGFYTRFGDVRPLLRQIDDRYVIMNAGDEMRLRFAAPAPPPAGWKRDFVFTTDGWTKDGNLNTGFSKTLLPLPLHNLAQSSKPPGALRDDAAYRQHPRDWQTFHTRYITAERFRAALRPNP